MGWDTRHALDEQPRRERKHKLRRVLPTTQSDRTRRKLVTKEWIVNQKGLPVIPFHQP